jgi:3-deoxy-manno-octulosonate cytidylyltransferase (CMP-KDO synthetase)
MVEHVYRRAAAARLIDAVVVATDDPRVVAAVEAFGGVARLTSGRHVTGTERVAEIARDLRCAIVVNVQGDEPLISPEAIDAALAPFADDPTVLMSTLRTPLVCAEDFTSPNAVKVVIDRQGDALYFSRAPIPHPRVRIEGAPVYKHLGLYAYRREFLLQIAALPPTLLEQTESLEQLRVLEHGYRIRTVETVHDSVGVDTPADLERVRRTLSAATRT